MQDNNIDWEQVRLEGIEADHEGDEEETEYPYDEINE
jgi:hypothetical protein